MIEAAIFGLGRWGRALVEASGGGLRFTRAVEPSMEAASGFCAQQGLRLSTQAEVLADPAIRAVVLATPHSLHRAQVEAAAAAGKAVFCEKPLALSTADARAMLGACRAAGVPMAVGHNRRFWPAIRALRGMIAEGSLGQLLHIEAHNSNLNSDSVTGGWRLAPGESPGGGMTGAGLHALDACIGLFGPLKRVTARLMEHPPVPAPRDSISVILEFANGTSGMMATIRATPFFWRVHVFGTEGSAEVLGETEMVVRRANAAPERITFPAEDSLRAELDAFAAQVEHGAAPAISERNVLATMIGFEAVVSSINAEAPIDCDEP
ncbi:MAG: gfo/Idh/MocA family oxidoreductase [Rubritepida sp.]|nr:gfo/Idh/MocA family oxidoreductase [Rubritepida sp.]